MSMSMHIVGIKPPDDLWKKMRNIWHACDVASVSLPEEVRKFFENGNPDPSGVLVDLDEADCVTKYDVVGKTGLEVDLNKLPRNITILRFYNGW